MRFWLCLLGAVTLSTSAIAQDHANVLTLPEGQSLLHISATERQEIAQDMLVASFRIEAEDAQSSTVQDEINKAMKDALDVAKDEDTLKVQTLQYNVYKTTRARTDEQVWRGSQGIEIKSTDSEAVLEASEKIQNLGFIANGLRYQLSPARAADIQDGMMEAALEKLQHRADRAAKALGKSRAELIEVNVSGGAMPAPVSMYRGAHMELAAMASDRVAPPVAKAGETTLNLTVNAKALLKP